MNLESSKLPARGLVLVASASAPLRTHLRRTFVAWGFDVLEAASAAVALDLTRRHAAQLALVDVALSAVDLARDLMELAPALKVALLVPEESEAELRGDGGIIGTVGMPLSPRTLDRVIGRVFGEL